MNRRGQFIFLGIMISIMVLIVAIAFIRPIKEQVTSARDPTNLDCNNNSISTGQQGACIITDWYLFGWVGTVFGVSIAFLGIKKWQNGE